MLNGLQAMPQRRETLTLESENVEGNFLMPLRTPEPGIAPENI